MHIYKTTNIKNGLIYIGQTTKEGKPAKNYLGSGIKIKKALRDDGKENFVNEVLEECANKDQLNEAEIYWIKFFGSTDPTIGYNVYRGGAISIEDLSRMLSEAIKKTLSTPEQKLKKSQRNRMFWQQTEYRKKCTESNIKTWSNETKKNEHSELMKVKLNLPSAIVNRSLALKSMPKLTCPHCGIICAKNHAISKHFDKCINHVDPIKREENLNNRKISNSNLPKVQCPHCGKSGLLANMNRWHFDNCKTIEQPRQQVRLFRLSYAPC